MLRNARGIMSSMQEKFICNVQQQLKQRMTGHVNNVVKLRNRGVCIDDFANHFAKHFKEGDVIKAKHFRKISKVHVIRECNLTLISKKLESNECQMCME